MLQNLTFLFILEWHLVWLGLNYILLKNGCWFNSSHIFQNLLNNYWFGSIFPGLGPLFCSEWTKFTYFTSILLTKLHVPWGSQNCFQIQNQFQIQKFLWEKGKIYLLINYTCKRPGFEGFVFAVLTAICDFKSMIFCIIHENGKRTRNLWFKNCLLI